MGSWYRLLEFHNGSVVTTTGFTIYNLLSNETKEMLMDSINNTLSLFKGNVSLLVDRNSIVISREFLGMTNHFTALKRINWADFRAPNI